MKIEPEELASVTRRLKRASGQLTGIIKMIEDGRECEDIVTQLAAGRKAVDRAGYATIATGLRQCMAQPEGESEESIEKLEKIFLSLA